MSRGTDARTPAIWLRLDTEGLEKAINEAPQDFDWPMIRRLKMAPALVKTMALPFDEQAQFLAKEQQRLKNQEERSRLDACMDFLKATGGWRGIQFHFPNLIVDDTSDFQETDGISMSSDKPLKWIETSDRPSSSLPTVTQLTSSNDVAALPRNYNKKLMKISDPDDDFAVSHRASGQERKIDPEVMRKAHEAGVIIDPNYLGEITYKSIDEMLILEEENTAVFIKYIDPSVSDAEIFAAIHEGSIYSFCKMDPKPPKFPHCGATVTFSTRTAAVNFLVRSNNTGIFLGGRRVRVVPSFIPSRGLEADKSHQTRVLKIIGPKELINADEIEQAFREKIVFGLIKRPEWVCGGKKKVEFHFHSILGQSRAACLKFSKYVYGHRLAHKIQFGYAEDPCARNAQEASPQVNGTSKSKEGF